MSAVRILYFTDILCVWAYIAERRVAELDKVFGDRIEIEPRFCSVFPDAWTKIETTWRDRGGYAAFNRHLCEVAERFPHIELSDRLWLDVRPRTSASAHLYIKAVEIAERKAHGDDLPPYAQRDSVRAAAAMRRAFFAQARDISEIAIQREISEELGIDHDAVRAAVASSEAVAALAADMGMAQQSNVTGSPTFIMNEGRQRLFGNVGYRLLEANVQELLRNPDEGAASWC
ncbi:hypothetical protein AVO45_02885 [Ruegeria marisrubri]|uniref:DSBA-like thioredoxin domain-containing protein n=1 Tax=Ruegeria marisrubri TaxID=1685379 RepID=A0A124F5Q0_9RHOB|nr:DsbA family protein [Ruegeria marisrubri]KUJ85936.1 hypothetical protein AVO45_02885 [Ruegeria marisrubri]